MNEQGLGVIACPVCGEDCVLKLTKKGKSYVNCAGCGSQTFARSVVSDLNLRGRVKAAAAGGGDDVVQKPAAPAPAVTVTKHTSDGQTERTIFDILGGLGKK